MVTYYLLNQNIGGIDSQFIFDGQLQPIMILSGRFGLNQNGLRLLTIDGQYLGHVSQLHSNFGSEYQLADAHHPIGQMTKLAGIWHQFAYVSNLQWTVLGSVTTNTYQISHGLRPICNAESVVTSKNLDGLKLSLSNDADRIPVFLVVATLNQWVLLSQRKKSRFFDPFVNIAIN